MTSHMSIKNLFKARKSFELLNYLNYYQKIYSGSVIQTLLELHKCTGKYVQLVSKNGTNSLFSLCV